MRAGAVGRTRPPPTACWADETLPGGVEPFQGDLERPESLAAPLDGVDAVFLLWPSLTAEGAPAILDVTRTVQDVTGTPARTFREWAVDHAGDFR